MKRDLETLFRVLIIALCTACGSPPRGGDFSNVPLILANNEIAPVSMTSYTRSDYGVYFAGGGSPRGALEPGNGCYLGAYVLADGNISGDMAEFDDRTGRRHALSVRGIRLGEELSQTWLLECIADMKTPYVIVGPPNAYNFFQEDKLENAAKGFGALSVPVFVDFYPDPRSYTTEPEQYIQFYRKARAAFAEHAPNTVFVSSVDAANVYDFSLFYPGDEYADWVGITILRPLYENGQVNLRNHMKDFDFFYDEFQRRKPLIVSQLAFSFYSTVDHRYASKDAAARLTDFYRSLEACYTRVKAVNYMDFNSIPGAPSNAERDNFAVTQDITVLSAYRDAVAAPWFISIVEAGLKRDTGETAKNVESEIFRSFFPVYEDENFKYVSASALDAEGIEFSETEGVVINGERYISTESLLESKEIGCELDDENRRIVLTQLPSKTIDTE